MKTPWGKADSITQYTDGVVFYTTPGHGGFKVSKEQLAKMPVGYRNSDGWYEEDCEAMKVYASFPQLFPELNATEMKNWCKYYFNEDGTYRTEEERHNAKAKDAVQVQHTS